MRRYTFPDGKRFAFSVVDDTDVATVENVLPLYRLLEQLGMRTTKTVWPMSCPEGSRKFSSSQTLEDPDYRAFVIDLQKRGFEIASHGATMESSPRARTLDAVRRFEEAFGAPFRLYVNHADNRENLYWGADRLDDPLLQALYRRVFGNAVDRFAGHVPDSPYWWGDVARKHVDYSRNLTFDEINLLRVNPTMPYSDPKRPLVRWWFSSSDADSAADFVRLLSRRNLDRLEREGGVCIVATHFGKNYVRDGRVDPDVEDRLRDLAGRNGWFVPASVLLDRMREQNGAPALPRAEWRRMQWRWAYDLVAHKLRAGVGLS